MAPIASVAMTGLPPMAATATKPGTRATATGPLYWKFPGTNRGAICERSLGGSEDLRQVLWVDRMRRRQNRDYKPESSRIRSSLKWYSTEKAPSPPWWLRLRVEIRTILLSWWGHHREGCVNKRKTKVWNVACEHACQSTRLLIALKWRGLIRVGCSAPWAGEWDEGAAIFDSRGSSWLFN